MAYRFNAPPTWPQPPVGWVPPQDWQPDASWPPPLPGWQFWQDDTLGAPGPAPVSAVPRVWMQPPANPTFGYAPARPVTQPIPRAQGFDPRLQAAVAAYSKRGYTLVTGQGPTVTLQRPATPFYWFWLAFSFFLGVGIGCIVVVLVWLLWRVPRTYSVALGLDSSGQIVELGDSCAVFDFDRLKRARIRSWIFGSLLAVLGTLMLVGLLVSPPSGGDWLSNIIIGIIFTCALATGAVLFLMAAAKATRQLAGR
jgi:hypothetical protein